MKSLTVFTPTYNRGYILPELYKSLCDQTCKDFVWIVVDDGSTDNTQELLYKWQDEKIIDMLFCYQDNGGKMRAHNRGVEMSETELFVCVDSDDKLASPTSIEDNLKFWELQKSQNFSGMISYWKTSGVISYKDISHRSSQFPRDLYCSPLWKIYEKGFRGDTTLMFRTEVLREFPFPEIEGEKFITEAYVYDQIDQKYQLILYPYYTQKCEYKNDGYTYNINNVKIHNPMGYMMYYNQAIRIGKGKKWRNISEYISMSLFARRWDAVLKCETPFLALLLFPLGIYKNLKLRYSIWRKS